MMAAPYLDAMSDYAASLLREAAGLTAVPPDQLGPWLRDHLIETFRDAAAKLDLWRASAARVERTRDELVAAAWEDARIAEMRPEQVDSRCDVVSLAERRRQHRTGGRRMTVFVNVMRECRLSLLYAVAMTKFPADDQIFSIVNHAIIRCMSLTALERIKRDAWRYFTQ